jgi:plasminogen activator inhibitor 1 RNA-binding protein
LNTADPDAVEQEVAAAAPVEEEEQVKTLEEYLAEKANKSLKVSLPEARKANDADESAFKGTVAFAKEEFEEFYVSKETKATSAKKNAEKANKKVHVDIEQRFQEKPRPEFRKNNNNDRRGGRGGNNSNKGGRKNNKSAAAPAVNLQDAAAFPTLGATA